MLFIPIPSSIRPLTSGSTQATTTVWSANFETGNNAQFNGQVYNTCIDGNVSVSTTIVHTGSYSGYYYGIGNGTSGTGTGHGSCREYPQLNLAVSPYSAYQPITDFVFDGWFYVPTPANGTIAGCSVLYSSYCSWISFATLASGTDWPFTIDGLNVNGSRRIALWIGNDNMTGFIQNINTSSPQYWNFDSWMELTAVAHIAIGTSNSDVTIYENGIPIIYYAGDVLSGPLEYAHFGLYMSQSNTQPIIILNDDLSIEEITQTTTTSATTSTTATSTSKFDMMTVSDLIVGGGNPSPATFNYVINGLSKSLMLTQTPQTVSVDPGSTWAVSPNPLGGSSSSQRWYSSQALTGTTSATTIVFSFQHQYSLTMLASGSGSATPSSGWYNSGAKVNIKATAITGHKFKSWTGSGRGSYTGTSASHTITMNSAVTETATFT
jgi:hypothetical protein